MKVTQQSKNLFNVVKEGSSRNRLDSPLLTPLSFGKLIFRTEEQGEGAGGRGEGEKVSISEPRKTGRVSRAGTFFYLITFLTKKGSFFR